MIKRSLLFLLVFYLIHVPAFSNQGFAADTIEVYGGQMKDNRVLIPLRTVSEHLGASVEWDQNTQTITITKDQINIVLVLNANTARVNDSEITLEVPAQQLYTGSTFVPLRFVSEGLDAEVRWDQQAQQVTITVGETTLIVKVEEPLIQVPSDRRITEARVLTLLTKLNEATDLSSIRQVRRYFRPYFTDELINSVLLQKGLAYKFKFNEPYYPHRVSYRSQTTAYYTESSEYYDTEPKFSTEKVLIRNAEFVYVNKVWKVSSVQFTTRDPHDDYAH